MYLQGVDNVFDLVWTERVEGGVKQTLTYRDVYHQNEVEQSTYNFEQSNVPKLFEQFAAYIGRIRALSRMVAQAYVDSREALGFPMLPSDRRRSAA